jgi:hypothetical protein
MCVALAGASIHSTASLSQVEQCLTNIHARRSLTRKLTSC